MFLAALKLDSLIFGRDIREQIGGRQHRSDQVGRVCARYANCQLQNQGRGREQPSYDFIYEARFSQRSGQESHRDRDSNDNYHVVVSWSRLRGARLPRQQYSHCF